MRTDCLGSLFVLGIMFLALVKFLRNVGSDTDGVVGMYGKMFLPVPLLIRFIGSFFETISGSS